MTPQQLLDFTQQGLLLALILALPCLLVAAVAGLLISMFQAVTQMQDQSFPLAVKLIVVFATLLVSSGWMGSRLFVFAKSLFTAAGAPQ
jgi:type III secretion protein S